MVTASRTAITATATNVAEPRSAHARLDRSHRVRPDGDPRQQHRMSGNRRNHAPTLFMQNKTGAERSDIVGGLRRVPVVAASGKTGRLTCGVDTPHLHRQGGEPSHT